MAKQLQKKVTGMVPLKLLGMGKAALKVVCIEVVEWQH
jgi:hypothetical protein